MDRERSWGALLLALVAVALLAGAYALPWWSYDSTTGRKTPEGGPQDPSDTRVERHSVDYLPFRLEGDQTPQDEAAARSAVLQIGVGWAIAAGGLALFTVAELVRFGRAVPRVLSLVLSGLSVLGTLGGLLVAYSIAPTTMRAEGVTGAFTDRLLDPHYITTELGLGWILAAVAVPMALGALGFRFQAGSHDPAAVEAYA